MSERDDRASGRDAGSWQRLVWARIALDRLRRSGWLRAFASNTVVRGGASMTDSTDHGPDVALQRPKRLRPSWPRRLARLTLFVCLCMAIIGRYSDIARVDRRADCPPIGQPLTSESAARPSAQACQIEFQRTHDPAVGLRLAEVSNEEGDAAAAKRTAISLLATSARSGALQLLGQIAHAEDRYEEAVIALEQARQLHRTEQNANELARDAGLLALAHSNLGNFAEALRLADECITEARRGGKTDQQFYCHLTAAKTLNRVGYWSAAEHEIEIARPLAKTDDQRSDLAYRLAIFAQESGRHASAVAYLTSALRLTKPETAPIWRVNTELNLAYSLAEQRLLDEAQRHLEIATVLDSDHKQEAERAWVAAQIAYQRHDLPRASSLTEKYFKLLGPDDEIDRDDQIDVATLQARIALEQGDLEGAARLARRGVEQAELVRGAQSALELRPWILAKRRAPYELLFTALASAGQVEAAAMAFDQWQARAVRDALARPRSPAGAGRRDIADQVTRLGEWLRVASRAPLARAADRAAVLDTLRGIDLIALIVADGHVWRLTASHGAPRLVRLAPLADLEDRIDRFRGSATDVGLASQLGALLIPDDAFRATREVLHVLVDGRLAGLPVAALRHGKTSLISMRPIVRVLRLPEARCAPATPRGRATVLAAPGPDLPNTLAEADQVAALLHGTLRTGAAATRNALFAAAGDAVLHVATHGEVLMDGGAIVLADGAVSALEISARQLAPALVVLAACSTATSDDDEAAGSLVAGFLGAGAQRVVATLRTISDAGALDITTRFYRAGGVADPARALAAVQSELDRPDRAGNADWPYVAVFGPDVCPDAASR